MVSHPFLNYRAIALLALLHALLTYGALAQDLVINEVDADQESNDSAEFIELYDGGVGNTPLDGLVVVLFNGSNDTSYLAFDLDGFSTSADGLFVIGNPGVPNVTIEFDPGSNGAIQNGADAVALFVGSESDFPNGTPVTSENLIDALVYGTNDGDAVNLLDVLVPGQEQVNDTATESMARSPDGGAPRITSTYINQTPSPGARNKADDSLNLGISIDPETISESADTPAVATITRSGPTDEEVTIVIEVNDRTEVTVESSAVFGMGDSEINVNITPVDDLWADGTQTVTVSVRQESNALNPAETTLDVEDDGDTNVIVVNEVYPAVDNFNGDANGDGEIANSLDEFVELVNASDAAFDLSGFTVWDSFNLQHTFLDGTLIDPGCALVLFGGGNIDEGLLEEFGNALVQKAGNEFGLNLNNSGDIISVRNLDGVEVAGASWDAVNSSDGSLARNPDITGDFVSHQDEGFDSFGPGYNIDGDPFCQTVETLTLEITPANISEGAGAAAATLTITRSGSTAEPLEVTLTNDDPSEIAIPAEATILADETLIEVSIDAVNDEAQDGTQTVGISASATGFVLGRAEIEVTDDGDAPVAVVINEFDSDQEGSDAQEFIELYDGGKGNLPLDGLIVVLFNGNGTVSYDTIDLNGQSTDANGFFVLGSADVPDVDLVPAGFQLQNGADGIAIYRDSVESFSGGTFVTETNLIDAVVYGTDDDDATDLLEVLTPGQGQLNEGPSNNLNALARVPDGGSPLSNATYQQRPPTPGRSNGEQGASGYSQWSQAYQGIGAIDDDGDLDTMNNALEYALDFNPLVSDINALPAPQLDANGNLEFALSKGVIAGADPKLTYIVEVSFNLIGWTTEGLTTTTDTPTDLVVVYAGEADFVYMRLRVELAE